MTGRWVTGRWVTGGSVPAISSRMVLANTLRLLLIAASQENLHKEGIRAVTCSLYFAVASIYLSGSPESLSERSQRLLASDEKSDLVPPDISRAGDRKELRAR